MNEFQEKLDDVLRLSNTFSNAKYIGRTAYIQLEKEIKIKAELIALSAADSFAEIDAEFSKLITSTNIENENDGDRETIMEKLLTEKNQLKKQLEEIELLKKNKKLTMSRLDEIYSTIDLLRNHPITYDDQIVREILECVVVDSKDKIKVIFKGGTEITTYLENL